MLHISCNKLPTGEFQVDRFFDGRSPSKPKTPEPNKIRVCKLKYETTRFLAISLRGNNLTTAWIQSNAFEWIVRKNFFTRLKVIRFTMWKLIMWFYIVNTFMKNIFTDFLSNYKMLQIIFNEIELRNNRISVPFNNKQEIALKNKTLCSDARAGWAW